MTYITLTESSSIGLNLLDNAGFEIWQRGASFSTPANNAYTADRWKVGKGGAPTFTVTQDTSVFDTGTSSMSINVTVANGATDLAPHQAIEGITNTTVLAGKTVTFTARVKASVASTVRAGISISAPSFTGYVFSSYHTGNGAWQTLTVTTTLPSDLTSFEPYVGILSGTVVVTQFWVDNCVFVTGASAPTFQPLHPQVDLARCMRYYIQYDVTNSGDICMCMNYSSTHATGTWTFPVRMRVTPTVTVTNATATELVIPNGGGGLAGLGTTAISPGATPFTGSVDVTVAAGLTSGDANKLVATGSFILAFSADL